MDGVLFDVDDTLVDSRAAFGAALAAVRRVYLPHLDAGHDVELLTMWRDDVGGHYRQYCRGLISNDEQRRRRADELHRAYGGAPVDEALYPAWNDLFWGTFTRSWTAHPDVAPVLVALAAAGVRVGAVTNAAAALQEAKLAAAGIAGVPVLVGVDTLGFGKPDPRVFHEGCRRLGTVPERTAYVGDEAFFDACAASQAGLVGVWLDRPGNRRPTDELPPGAPSIHQIADLHALPALLGLA